MDMRPLGKTGITVSSVCLGAMMYGSWGNPDHNDCIRQIHHALDHGVNFIDTADAYSSGESEEIVGKAIAGRRDDVIVATKFFARMGRDPNRQGASRRWIMSEVESSLRRLGVDTIDLYQCHRFPETMDVEETITALTDLQRAGKIRSFGSSAFGADRIVESHWISERGGFGRFRSEQCSYSLLSRLVEGAVLPAVQRYGMGAITYSPLAGGWLSGKFRTMADFTPESRPVRMTRAWGGFDPQADINRRRLELVVALGHLADEAGLPLPHLATAFTLVHPAVTSVIVGPRTFEQLTDLLVAAEVTLDADLLDRLDELCPPGVNFAPIDPSSAPPAILDARLRRR